MRVVGESRVNRLPHIKSVLKTDLERINGFQLFTVHIVKLPVNKFDDYSTRTHRKVYLLRADGIPSAC